MPTAHESFLEQLLDLAYGELGRRKARALRAHLERCADCRAELDRMTATRSALSALGMEPAPLRGEGVLKAAAREAAREHRQRPFLPSWMWGASIGAVTAAAVAIVSVRLVPAVRSPSGRPGPAEWAIRAPASEPPEPARQGKLASPAYEAPAAKNAARERAAPALRKGAFAPAAAGPAGDEVPRERDRSAPGASPDAAVATGNASAAAAAQPGPAPAAADRLASPASPAPAARLKTPGEDLGLAAEKSEVGPERGGPVAPRVAAAAAPEDPIERHARLRAAGRLRSTTVFFPGCPGEVSREVERDEKGQVVKYTRRGDERGTPFQAELYYGEDGLLGAVRYRAEGAVHELRLGAAAPEAAEAGIPPWALEPGRSAEAGPGAPPRCGR